MDPLDRRHGDIDPFALLRDHIDSQFLSVHRRIDDKTGEVSRDIEDFKSEVRLTLNGNGSPGLVRLVDRHEQRLNGERADAAKHGTLWGSAAGLVVSVIVGVLAYFGVKPPQ